MGDSVVVSLRATVRGYKLDAGPSLVIDRGTVGFMVPEAGGLAFYPAGWSDTAAMGKKRAATKRPAIVVTAESIVVPAEGPVQVPIVEAGIMEITGKHIMVDKTVGWLGRKCGIEWKNGFRISAFDGTDHSIVGRITDAVVRGGEVAITFLRTPTLYIGKGEPRDPEPAVETTVTGGGRPDAGKGRAILTNPNRRRRIGG